MKYFLILVFAVLTACTTTPQVGDADSPGGQLGSDAANVQSKHKDLSGSEQTAKFDRRYNELIENVKEGATLEQFEELRQTYVHTSYYQPYLSAERGLTETMFAAMEGNDTGTCLEDAQKILAENYISLNAHFAALVCNTESGAEKQGDFHRYVLDGLLEAIWASGDGQSTENAFFCTSTTELYAFLNLTGYKASGQALVNSKDGIFDVMTVTELDSGKEVQLYFDVGAMWARGFRDLD